MISSKSHHYLKFLVIFSIIIYLILMSIILCAKLINFQYIKIDGIFSYETNPNQTRNLIKKLNDEKYSIIFGSSRIQQVSSSIVKENLLNLNYIYARPDAIYDFLKKLDQNHWENIERIYVSLDLHSLTTEKYFVNVEEIFIETPKLEFLLQTIKESISFNLFVILVFFNSDLVSFKS